MGRRRRRYRASEKPRRDHAYRRASSFTNLEERNLVDFNGEVTSLSDAALQAFSQLGFQYTALRVPWEWTYDGKRLDEIRREIEAASD